jgi:cytochrome b561
VPAGQLAGTIGVMDPTPAYTRTAVALHWLMALMIVGSFGVGVYMADLPRSPTKGLLFDAHKSAGATILALAALRLLWRLAHRPPADLPMPRWQRRAAHAAHAALYLLFFAVPLAGWAYSSAAGYPLVWFGVWPLPDFVPVNRTLADSFKLVHKVLAFALGATVVAHVAGALKHQFVDRDGLMRRMWPARR